MFPIQIRNQEQPRKCFVLCLPSIFPLVVVPKVALVNYFPNPFMSIQSLIIKRFLKSSKNVTILIIKRNIVFVMEFYNSALAATQTRYEGNTWRQISVYIWHLAAVNIRYHVLQKCLIHNVAEECLTR